MHSWHQLLWDQYEDLRILKNVNIFYSEFIVSSLQFFLSLSLCLSLLPAVLCCPNNRCNWRFIWALVLPGKQALSMIFAQLPTPNFIKAFLKVSDSSSVQPGDKVQFQRLAESLDRSTLRAPAVILRGLAEYILLVVGKLKKERRKKKKFAN